MRVLIVDKDPYDLDAMRVGLSSPDLEIASGTDGDEALVAVIDDPPRVVLAGASLGQMGGFALSREIKALHDRGDLPDVAVVVLLERAADRWLADWSRCDAHRVKPVDLEDLDRLVRQLGARPRERSGA